VHRQLDAAGIRTAFFVDPDPDTLRCVAGIGGRVVELHTGAYAEATTNQEAVMLLHELGEAAELAAGLGLEVHAGHGLHLDNVASVAALAVITELNIGHAIVARALFVGMRQAVAEMKARCLAARQPIDPTGDRVS
jgi:pyridoxine 5-phosphate synthase